MSAAVGAAGLSLLRFEIENSISMEFEPPVLNNLGEMPGTVV